MGKVSLNLEESDVIETLKLIGKLGDYGIVIVRENSSNSETSKNQKLQLT